MKSYFVNLLVSLVGIGIIYFQFDIELKESANWFFWLLGLFFINLGGSLSQVFKGDNDTYN
ncbi:hypothetical protein M3649_03725 [Ureibacillus chungkukjangi]|uniref:hypothetical protein n=1 Tax=Ureibacillus chungkukjangi TaxID=1202712 RepID=UPI002041EAEC|nr:hypothetical protein [Ureibacillus chungkukjangi]MCM3387240.1 hypothetical protein [Ureibacillus chungkukjangi]